MPPLKLIKAGGKIVEEHFRQFEYREQRNNSIDNADILFEMSFGMYLTLLFLTYKVFLLSIIFVFFKFD